MDGGVEVPCNFTALRKVFREKESLLFSSPSFGDRPKQEKVKRKQINNLTEVLQEQRLKSGDGEDQRKVNSDHCALSQSTAAVGVRPQQAPSSMLKRPLGIALNQQLCKVFRVKESLLFSSPSCGDRPKQEKVKRKQINNLTDVLQEQRIKSGDEEEQWKVSTDHCALSQSTAAVEVRPQQAPSSMLKTPLWIALNQQKKISESKDEQTVVIKQDEEKENERKRKSILKVEEQKKIKMTPDEECVKPKPKQKLRELGDVIAERKSKVEPENDQKTAEQAGENNNEEKNEPKYPNLYQKPLILHPKPQFPLWQAQTPNPKDLTSFHFTKPPISKHVPHCLPNSAYLKLVEASEEHIACEKDPETYSDENQKIIREQEKKKCEMKDDAGETDEKSSMKPQISKPKPQIPYPKPRTSMLEPQTANSNLFPPMPYPNRQPTYTQHETQNPNVQPIDPIKFPPIPDSKLQNPIPKTQGCILKLPPERLTSCCEPIKQAEEQSTLGKGQASDKINCNKKDEKMKDSKKMGDSLQETLNEQQAEAEEEEQQSSIASDDQINQIIASGTLGISVYSSTEGGSSDTSANVSISSNLSVNQPMNDDEYREVDRGIPITNMSSDSPVAQLQHPDSAVLSSHAENNDVRIVQPVPSLQLINSNTEAEVEFTDRPRSLVPISEDDHDFQVISQEFKNACRSGGYNISNLRIMRNDDKLAHEIHLKVNEKAKADLGTNIDAHVSKHLWFAAPKVVIFDVSRRGFNRAIAGGKLVRFGEGVYFVVDPSYCIRYGLVPDGEVCYIIRAKVITGRSCQAQENQRILPYRCHSAVDPLDSPSIYMIYDDWGAFPEFVLSFNLLQ